ncbi:hypothetical protein B0H17DRAFT_128742 [Mycena rosella]|uniref:Uncharacterized protein n=1 Tax=Mycena rosella TaxID=1033263 RepID=A0AAD7F7Q2_MYCRO|nr:hypothetical protein B0H17DRAFT_128742 [Mycena rosella]
MARPVTPVFVFSAGRVAIVAEAFCFGENASTFVGRILGWTANVVCCRRPTGRPGTMPPRIQLVNLRSPHHWQYVLKLASRTRLEPLLAYTHAACTPLQGHAERNNSFLNVARPGAVSPNGYLGPTEHC